MSGEHGTNDQFAQKSQPVQGLSSILTKAAARRPESESLLKFEHVMDMHGMIAWPLQISLKNAMEEQCHTLCFEHVEQELLRLTT